MNCWVMCRLCVTQFYYQATWRKIIPHDASLSNSAQWGFKIFLSKSHFGPFLLQRLFVHEKWELEIWFFQPDYVNLVFVTSRQHHLGFFIKKYLALCYNGYRLPNCFTKIKVKNGNTTIIGVDIKWHREKKVSCVFMKLSDFSINRGLLKSRLPPNLRFWQIS